eukprot:g40547.t1
MGDLTLKTELIVDKLFEEEEEEDSLDVDSGGSQVPRTLDSRLLQAALVQTSEEYSIRLLICALQMVDRLWGVKRYAFLNSSLNHGCSNGLMYSGIVKMGLYLHNKAIRCSLPPIVSWTDAEDEVARNVAQCLRKLGDEYNAMIESHIKKLKPELNHLAKKQ